MAKRDWERRWRSHGGDGLDELGREVLTALREHVPWSSSTFFLEGGAGTGSISLELARAGVHVAMFDFTGDAVDSIRSRWPRDIQPAALVVADARHLPFRDESFDVVWSSGLLEHFSEADLALCLDEMARVSRRHLVSFVPNLNSSFYLLWSYLLKLKGRWTVGYESPKATLRYAFENAGLEVLDEFSIGFLPENFLAEIPSARLREHLAFHYRQLPPDRREGYLLATIGVKSDARPYHPTVDYTEEEDARFGSLLIANLRSARARSLYFRARNFAGSVVQRMRRGE